MKLLKLAGVGFIVACIPALVIWNIMNGSAYKVCRSLPSYAQEECRNKAKEESDDNFPATLIIVWLISTGIVSSLDKENR